MNNINTIIVDDHPIFRDGFKSFLKNVKNVDKIYEASDVKTFINILNNNEIDLAFVDINMPDKDGVEGSKEALLIKPKLKIIGISSFGDIEYVDKMLVNGAKGYILKDSSTQDIETAIEKVMNGEYYFSNSVLAQLSKRAVLKKDIDNTSLIISQITEREKEVLTLLCHGVSRTEIAQKLFISERTVDKHRENLLAKTETSNVVKLVMFAIKNRIVDINEI